MKSSSRYSLVHFLPTSSSKSAPAPSVFQIYVITYLMMMWLTYGNSGSRYSLRHLLPTSSSKSAPNVTVFYDFYMKSSSRYSDVHLLSTTLPDRAPQLRKLRPFGDHGSHLIYPKKCRASRPRMFSSLNSCVPDLSHSSTNTYMMMWWP